jgi:GT2 family glycosyltransferase
VAITILNWNGWRDTIECLESVRRLDYPNYLTIVVDNGSTNGSAEKIKAWAEQNLGPGHALADYSRASAITGGESMTENPLDRTPSAARLVLIRNEENLGFSGGNNVALHYALHRRVPADYVFLLNNDAAPKVDCLSLLVAAERSTGAGIAGAVVLMGDGPGVEFARCRSQLAMFFAPIVKSCVPMPEGGEAIWESLFVHGAAMLIRRDVLQAIHSDERGYLDERLFLYYEEVVFCNAARKRGFRSIVVRDASVGHKGSRSSGGYANPIHAYYAARNRILMAREFLPLGWRMVFYLAHTSMRLVAATKNLRARRFRSARAALWGLVDGYRGVTGKWRDHDEEIRLLAAAKNSPLQP